LWHENNTTKIPISILSDEISIKINKLFDSIKESNLWTNKAFVNKVMAEALPFPLIEKLGLETILKRVPENYLMAIFSAHLASKYVYTYGRNATEFEFFEFMSNY
jgi:glutamate dehydrogenase